MRYTYKSLLELMALLALSACASVPTLMHGKNQSIAIEPDYRNMGTNGAALIANSHGRARQDGDDLILTFTNGQSRTFHSDDKGCQDGPEHCDGYVLMADLPQFHWFLIYERFYEGGRITLYDDRGGLPTEIPYFPAFSPDGQRILIQNDDVSSEFDGDNLEIWRREGSRIVREWSANPDETDTGVPYGLPYHTEVRNWQGDRITLTMSARGAYDMKTKTSAPDRQWTATLTRRSDGWHLKARAP
jgi:hypothetical protein